MRLLFQNFHLHIPRHLILMPSLPFRSLALSLPHACQRCEYQPKRDQAKRQKVIPRKNKLSCRNAPFRRVVSMSSIHLPALTEELKLITTTFRILAAAVCARCLTILITTLSYLPTWQLYGSLSLSLCLSLSFSLSVSLFLYLSLSFQ